MTTPEKNMLFPDIQVYKPDAVRFDYAASVWKAFGKDETRSPDAFLNKLNPLGSIEITTLMKNMDFTNDYQHAILQQLTRTTFKKSSSSSSSSSVMDSSYLRDGTIHDFASPIDLMTLHNATITDTRVVTVLDYLEVQMAKYTEQSKTTIARLLTHWVDDVYGETFTNSKTKQTPPSSSATELYREIKISNGNRVEIMAFMPTLMSSVSEKARVVLERKSQETIWTNTCLLPVKIMSLFHNAVKERQTSQRISAKKAMIAEIKNIPIYVDTSKMDDGRVTTIDTSQCEMLKGVWTHFIDPTEAKSEDEFKTKLGEYGIYLPELDLKEIYTDFTKPKGTANNPMFVSDDENEEVEGDAAATAAAAASVGAKRKEPASSAAAAAATATTEPSKRRRT